MKVRQQFKNIYILAECAQMVGLQKLYEKTEFIYTKLNIANLKHKVCKNLQSKPVKMYKKDNRANGQVRNGSENKNTEDMTWENNYTCTT